MSETTATYWRQPTETDGVTEDGTRVTKIVYKGNYDDLEGMAEDLAVDSAAEEGLICKNWELARANGGLGILTINCTPDEQSNPEGGTPEQVPLKEIWTIHTVRNDRSVYAYCGDSVGANPLRDQVEQWQKETDYTLSSEFQFRDTDGKVTDLTEPSKALAQKIAQGIESVVRFYPVITRKRIYAKPPDECLDGIGFIDEPPIDGSSLSPNCRKPSTLADKIDSYEWLKMQDDCDEQTDGTWSRVESWWGSEKWDEDLYGTNRWEFPASIT